MKVEYYQPEYNLGKQLVAVYNAGKTNVAYKKTNKFATFAENDIHCDRYAMLFTLIGYILVCSFPGALFHIPVFISPKSYNI